MVSVVVVRTLRPTDGLSFYLCFPQRKLSEGIRCSDPRARKAWELGGAPSASFPAAFLEPLPHPRKVRGCCGRPSRAGMS